MKRELISIVIPIYNSEKFLNQCISSILNQTYSNIEVILINDGSTDNSVKICEQFAMKDKRIKLINQRNLGVSQARNIGIKNSQGEYIYFMDSDDYIENDTVEYLISAFRKNNNIDLVMFGYYINNNIMHNNIKINKSFNSIETAKIISGLKYNCRGYLWNKVFKSSIIKEYEIFFSPEYHICEDALFCQKYVRYIDKSIYLSEAKYHYIKHDNSTMRQKLNLKRLSVLNAYKEIINTCQSYNNKELNLQLYCNYIRHNILIIKSIILEFNVEYLYFGEKAYFNLKKHFFIYIFNKNISFRHKALGIGVLIAFPIFFCFTKIYSFISRKID